MSNRGPWKPAIVGMVTVIAGMALISGTWALAELVAFLAMFFVARGALHIVTTPSFEGVTGALAALHGGGEIGVGLIMLMWPNPTLLVVVVVIGTWVVIRAVVAATIVVTTRLERHVWAVQFASLLVEVAFGIALMVQPVDSVERTAWILGVLAVFSGGFEIALALSGARVERRRSTQPVPASS